MAFTDTFKRINLGHLKTFADEVKSKYATKTALSAVETKADAAFKSAEITGNLVKFYKSADKSGTAAFSFDFPAEMFLDQAETKFVANFAWSEELYPGSTNPNLDGKPVMVLAVKTDDRSAADADSVNYSFISVETLFNIYTAKVNGKDPSTTVTIDGYVIDVKVNISETENNLLEAKNDGLYVGHDAAKADKVTGATKNNVVVFGDNGNIADAGKSIGGAEFAETPNANTLATEVGVIDAISGKANKVASATNGHLAGLNANGDLTDSGKASGTDKLADTPNVNTLATEAAVADQISKVIKYSDIQEVTEAEIIALLADEPAAD